MDDRTEPPAQGSEADTLLGFLEFLRETIAMKVEGLGEEQLRRTHPPSTMTLGGMLHHLCFVEDWWFTVVLRGDVARPPFDEVDWEADPDWDWHAATELSAEQLRARWEGFVQASRLATTAALEGQDGMETLAQRRTHGQEVTLRWILVHMIEEYARHAGHADLIRESIDGATGQ